MSSTGTGVPLYRPPLTDANCSRAWLPAKTFGTLMSVEPAFGALSGLLLLGELLAPRQWVALAAIIAASVGTTATAARLRDPPPLAADPTVGDLETAGERPGGVS